MPSFAMVISFTYCSGVACPGTTALFTPSIPSAIAPLRFTFAFSNKSTSPSGNASFALIAATVPAVPPPITKISTRSEEPLTAAFLINEVKASTPYPAARC
jgi:hypothetical protein